MPRPRLGGVARRLLPSHPSVMHQIRSYKRLYLNRGSHHHLVRRWYYHRRLRLWRRRSHRSQVLYLGIDGLLVACFEPAPLAHCSTPDSLALFTGLNLRRDPVWRYQHFGTEQGGKENGIPDNTARVTVFAGAGKWNFTTHRLLIQYVSLLVDGECLLDSHPRVDMVE
jgi:hypothetical protein